MTTTLCLEEEQRCRDPRSPWQHHPLLIPWICRRLSTGLPRQVHALSKPKPVAKRKCPASQFDGVAGGFLQELIKSWDLAHFRVLEM